MLSTQFIWYFYKKFIIKTTSKKIYYLVFLIVAFSFINTFSYSQEIKTKSAKNFPNTFKDSIKVPIKDSLVVKPKDSIKNDTVKKELLESIIDHTADSLIRQDLKNKKITLYKKAHIHYNDIDLQAGFIEIDNNTNTVFAKGLIDSEGNYNELPVFKQGSQESTQDSILFNFKSEKAVIYNLRTEQQGLIIRGEVSKKYNDSVVFIKNIKITSSQKENPDYYIDINKAKFIKDKKLVAGRSQLVIADVPTPAILPFAYIPLTKGRTSGFLMPTWGENREQGYFLQNGGYYFVINDNFDLALLGDIYTNGSWGLRAESAYKKRYKYSGRFNFRYQYLINSLKGLDDYLKSAYYNLSWTHSQDAKASPNSRFSASVNLGSSKYYRESINEYDINNSLTNTLSSSISYSKDFVGTPFKMSLSVTHSQNTNTEKITMTLPSLQVNMDRIYPFAGKYGAKKNALQKTGLTYSLRSENRINTNDDYFLKKEMFDDAKTGIQHNASLSTNMKALKYFTISPSVNYKEVWYFDRLKKKFDDVQNAVVTDTINSFSSFREYSTSASLSTTLYGMFKFKKGRIEAIRHVVRPSISYGYSPDFSFYNEEYEQEGEIIEYSPFSNGIYGSPGSGISNSLSFSLNNNIEAKVRPKDSTDTESKKIVLLNSLNFSSGYNFAADSLKWRPVSVSASTRIFDNKLGINANASLDPYAIDVNGRRINTFNINNGGSLFRLTNARLTMNYSFSSSSKGKKSAAQQNEDANNSNGIFGENITATNRLDGDGDGDGDEEKVKQSKLYQVTFPWSLKLAYTIGYNNSNRQNEISSNSLMFSGDIELTPKWAIGFNSGYDIKNQGFTPTQLRFSRDLDSWKLNFNWVPFGNRQTYYFFIGVKSSMLSDIKYDKRQIPDRRLF